MTIRVFDKGMTWSKEDARELRRRQYAGETLTKLELDVIEADEFIQENEGGRYV